MVKQIKKIGKNSWNWRSKNSYLQKDLMNFHEIFRKDVTYDDIKLFKSKALPSLQALYFLKYILRVKVWIFFFNETVFWMKHQISNLSFYLSKNGKSLVESYLPWNMFSVFCPSMSHSQNFCKCTWLCNRVSNKGRTWGHLPHPTIVS